MTNIYEFFMELELQRPEKKTGLNLEINKNFGENKLSVSEINWIFEKINRR